MSGSEEKKMESADQKKGLGPILKLVTKRGGEGRQSRSNLPGERQAYKTHNVKCHRRNREEKNINGRRKTWSRKEEGKTGLRDDPHA